MERKVKLKHLLKNLPELIVKGSREIEITAITADSRTASPGALFIAKKGSVTSGAEYIEEAIKAGAAAVVTDFFDPFLEKTQVIVGDPRKIEAPLAARFYDNPSLELFVVGITGTKGKTTTSYLVRHLLENLGNPTGLIGTVETIIGENRYPSSLTTHDVIQNQRRLYEMVHAGCKAAVLEVSSHGLEQNRVGEISFDLALFTNLTPDHLDYHKTIEEYASAKRMLFERAKEGIFNADSPWTEFMRNGREAFTFGIEKRADVWAEAIQFLPGKMEFVVKTEKESARITTSLIGRHNVYNLLGAVSVGLKLKAPLEEIARILSTFEQVPGRLERVPNPFDLDLFVDFAHSGESLANVLRALQEVKRGKLIVVFGAGGNRPKERRSGMAEAAEKLADLSIITSDNPRLEDPEAICQEILSHFKQKEKALIEVDRKRAIEKAIGMARQGDVILIAGKGHEKVQIGKQTFPFDDVQVAKDLLFCNPSLSNV